LHYSKIEIFSRCYFNGICIAGNINLRKIDRVKKRFSEEGFDFALNGRKGSGIYAKNPPCPVGHHETRK